MSKLSFTVLCFKLSALVYISLSLLIQGKEHSRLLRDWNVLNACSIKDLLKFSANSFQHKLSTDCIIHSSHQLYAFDFYSTIHLIPLYNYCTNIINQKHCDNNLFICKMPQNVEKYVEHNSIMFVYVIRVFIFISSSKTDETDSAAI